MKELIEVSEQDIKDLRAIKNYFGEHDKSLFEHHAFAFLDKMIKSIKPETLQSKGKTKEEVIKDNLTILESCFEDAPVDFLGTGCNSREADKECSEWNQKWRASIENIKQALESHANKDGWVSCAERLPEDDVDTVLFCTASGYISQGFFDGKEWFETYVKNYHSDVTHWMPLPPKPQI